MPMRELSFRPTLAALLVGGIFLLSALSPVRTLGPKKDRARMAVRPPTPRLVIGFAVPGYQSTPQHRLAMSFANRDWSRYSRIARSSCSTTAITRCEPSR